MPRLILTTDGSGAGALRAAGIADIVVPFRIRFVWAPLPSDAELATFLEARSRKHDSPDSHWLDFVRRVHREPMGGKALGLINFCERCETIELWADPEPNAQLTLIWLLDYLAPSREHRFKADVGPGECPDRRSPAERNCRMAANGRQNPERASGNSQRGLAGLSCAYAGGLVQSA